MTSAEKQASDSLVRLVEHVFTHRDGPITGITYEELAARIGRLTWKGVGHAHGMGNVLGIMGRMLQGLEGVWGEQIPHLQSLVVLKSGQGKNLPDIGLEEFWPDYPKMTEKEKARRVKVEYQRIVEYGSRWNDVLDRLGLPPVTAEHETQNTEIPYGTAGESERHRRLKEFIRQHPEIVGATGEWQAFVEYPLTSLDVVDVFFKCPDECVAVEVKSAISDAYPADYERGLFQAIKYCAVLKAMSQAGTYGIPSAVRSVLVLESTLPTQWVGLAQTLHVPVIERVRLD
jgi:hypothetical protein